MKALLSVRSLLLVLLLAIYSEAARADFVEQVQFGQGATIPVAWGDADADGDLDLAVGHYLGANLLFLNQGDGTFVQQSQFGSGATFAVVWGDCDNDGDEDLAVGRGAGQQNLLFVNNGNGSFTPQNQFGALSTISLAWADYDLDGDLDLAVGNGILGAVQQNYLYVNNGNGTFTRQAQFGTGQTASVVWGDFDNDGDPDLAAGNGGFGFVGQNYLYVNNGDGTFTERPEFGTGDTASLAWGDCDNDGDLDLAVGNWNATQCLLYVNNGDGSFTMQAQFGSRDTNTLSWGDADNDGDLDLAVGNGDFETAEQNFLYVNGGDGTFTEQAEFGLGSTDAVAWGDSDGDGDLDLAVGNEHSPGQNYLYVNQVNDGADLVVHLIGHRSDYGLGHSNRDAIGAKVAVYTAGHLGEPAHLLGYREIEAHGGFSAQTQRDAHFGLSGVASVDLRITWPGSMGFHQVQDLAGVAAGQKITVDEPMSVSAPEPGGLDRPARLTVSPNPATDRVNLRVQGAGRFSAFTVHDVQGRLVRLFEAGAGDTGAGAERVWDGRTEAGQPLPAGVYYVRVRGAHPVTPARLVLVR